MPRPLAALALLLALAACAGGRGGGPSAGVGASGGGFTGSGLGGKAALADQRVNWGEAPAGPGEAQDGLTPMLFLFAADAPDGMNGVTDEDWRRDAARQNLSVEMLKSIRGKDVFLSPEGHIWPCTYFAVKAGRCKHAPALSMARRIEIARQVLAEDGRCRMAPFDPAWHRARARAYGAGDASLHVRADCR